jgi:hypothetical protein
MGEYYGFSGSRMRGVWTRSNWLRIGTGTCECGNETSGFIKFGEFLD